MRRCAKLSAAALVDAALLVLLRCTCCCGMDAFVRTHLQESTRWPKHHQHGRTQQLGQSLPYGDAQPLAAPAALRPGRDLRRARLHVLHGTFGRLADDEVPRSGILGQEQSQDNLRDTPAWVGDVQGSPAVSKGTVSGEEGVGMGGFGWLREFGNGKMDIAGLVLSTVLLMTAAAPLGVAADLAIADGRGVESQLNDPAVVHRSAESTVDPSRPPEADLADQHSSSTQRTKGTNRVGPLSLNGAALKLPTPVPAGDADSKRTGPLAQIAGNTVSAMGDVADRARALAASSHDQDRHVASAIRDVVDRARAMAARSHGTDRFSNAPEVSEAPASPQRVETSPANAGNLGSLAGGGGSEAGSVSSPEAGTTAIADPTSANAFRLEEHEDTGPENGLEALQSKALEKLESEHAELFSESLPLSIMPESFNRAVRKTLPALIPPAMAVFLTVSMPAVLLLLKGVGTTLLAVAKGYRNGGRRRSEGGYESGGAVEVGFGGSGGAGDGGGGQTRRGRATENPGSTFQMFLGGNGGDTVADDAGASGMGNGDGGKAGRGSRVGEGPDGSSMVPAPPLPAQQVNTDRHGVFSKQRQHGSESTTGRSRSSGGFAVGDDAMAAMALAAMTQELSVMKQSLQAEVKSMKTELQRASDDSKRLTEKLCRLEEDNRQLEAVVSRLGGQDARKLKAQLFALLASPSLGQLGDSSSFSPQLAPT